MSQTKGMASTISQTKTPNVARRTRRLVLSGTATAPAFLAACAFPAKAQEGPEAAPARSAPGAPETPAASLEAGPAEESAPEVLAATPECADDDDVTPAQTEGPYFTPNSPERSSLIE